MARELQLDGTTGVVLLTELALTISRIAKEHPEANGALVHLTNAVAKDVRGRIPYFTESIFKDTANAR